MPTYFHSEPAATAFRDNGGAWSMHVFANQFDNAGVLTHACTKTYNTPWCIRAHPISNAQVGDPSADFKATSVQTMQVAMLNASTDAINWYRLTGDPCPAACTNATWTECRVTPASIGMTNVDYPQVLWDNVAGRARMIYTAVNSVGNRQPVITRMDSCGSQIHKTPSSCSLWGIQDLTYFRGAVDSSGNVHLVGVNWSASPKQVFHTTFSPSNGFQCNYDVVDTYVPPATGFCGGCSGIATYQNTGSGCLRANFNASIAIDVTASPNTIIVALASQGTNDSSQALEAQTRVYRSVDGGTSWTKVAYSEYSSYHPQVRQFYTAVGNVSGLFHIISVFDLDAANPNSNARTVGWRSANQGLSWSAQYIDNGPRFILPTGHGSAPCYWGDYEAIAPDPGHSSIFYGWGQLNASTNVWDIQGLVNNQ